MSLLFLAVIAYLLGSIPTSVWVSKCVFKKDIRHYGSGNAGATNSFRYLGARWAVFILVVDIAKGFVSVFLLSLLPHRAQETGFSELNQQLLLGIAAVIGHIYPIFAGFRGGKGVATFFGVIIAVGWQYMLIALLSFIVVYAACHYVAIASMCGGVAFALGIIFINQGNNYYLSWALAVFGALLVIYKHKSNIRRLLNHTEDKTYIFKKTEDKLDK